MRLENPSPRLLAGSFLLVSVRLSLVCSDPARSLPSLEGTRAEDRSREVK